MNGTSIQTVLVNAPYIKSFSLQQIPYLLTGVVLLFSLGVCPALLLCLYPTRPFKRLTLCCRYRCRNWINIFADSFQGCYRMGPFGTSLYIMIPSAYMFLLIGIFSLDTTPPRLLLFQRRVMYLFPLFMCQPLLFACLKPCKSQLMNVSLTFHTALVSLLIVLVLQFGVVMYVRWTGEKQLALASLVGSTHRTLNTCSTHCIIIYTQSQTCTHI